MPGVEALGVELGGRSRANAAAALQQNWERRAIVLDAGYATWSDTPPALGLLLDVGVTVQTAYERGRSLDRIGAALRGNGRLSIPLTVVVDPTIAEANLRDLRPQVQVPPADAGVRVLAGRVEAIPPVTGRALDISATIAWIQQHVAQVVNEGRIELVTVAVPPTISDVSALVVQANQWLASELVVRAYDPVTDREVAWAVAPDVWGKWASLSVDPQDPMAFDWEIHTEKVRAFLTIQATTLGADRFLDLGKAVRAVEDAILTQSWDVRLRVYHHQRRHIIQFGETVSSIARDHGIPYPWIQQVNPSVGDSLRPGEALIIPSPDVLLPFPVVENKRIVVSISRQAMWIYENDALLWVWSVSTGIESSPTAPGVFQILSHEPNAYAASWDLWMPYFMGIYRPVPTSGFMNGFHGFPTRDGTNLLWTGNLGHPVTFGCILISTQNAAALYEWAEEGVIVEVRP